MALRPLRAGELTALFDDHDGHLRHIRCGGVEVLRGLYAAVRDRNWDTIQPQLHDLTIRESGDTVELRFQIDCVAGPIDFTWQGAITLDGRERTIAYEFAGRARSTFLKNRVGFCVLHGAGCAGGAATIETVGGATREGHFPAAISPHQPFASLRALTHSPAPGMRVRVEMQGDTFEMEDQRNWTDASFKTYCTPLGLPFPAELASGSDVRQSVVLRIAGTTPVANAGNTDSEGLRVILGARRYSLPLLGFGLPAREIDLAAVPVAVLRPAHLRVDLKGGAESYAAELQRAGSAATDAGAKLEVALHLSAPTAEAQLRAMREAVLAQQRGEHVARWLVFCRGEKTTSARWLRLAREILGPVAPGAALVGGTNAYFTELNRERPDVAACDAVTFSVNPQVHAFDDLSLIETAAMQGEVVRNAAAFAAPRPVIVSPVTLRPRFNPNATADNVPLASDPRQATCFGALWTLASLKHLAETGAASVTYYETAGPNGLGGPGGRYPVWLLFRALADFVGAEVIPVASADLLQREALLLARGSARRLLVATFADTAGSLPGWVPSSAACTVLVGDPATANPRRALPPRSLVQCDWTDTIP